MNHSSSGPSSTATHDPEILRRLTARLRAASDAEWASMAHAMAPARGEAFAALWRRAKHRSLWLTSAWPKGAAAFTLFFVAGELAREFNPIPQEEFIARARARGPGPLNPEYRAAFLELWELAVSRLPGDSTTVEAVVLAGALASRARVDERELRRAWTPLAGVVSLDTIRPPTPPPGS